MMNEFMRLHLRPFFILSVVKAAAPASGDYVIGAVGPGPLAALVIVRVSGEHYVDPVFLDERNQMNAGGGFPVVVSASPAVRVWRLVHEHEMEVGCFVFWRLKLFKQPFVLLRSGNDSRATIFRIRCVACQIISNNPAANSVLWNERASRSLHPSTRMSSASIP